MSDYNEGDLVEAVKGESVVRGRVKLSTYADQNDYRYIGDSAAIYEVYLRDGWTVTVIERAKPKLPTANGSIVKFRSLTADVALVAIRISANEWLVSGRTATYDDASISDCKELVIL